MVSDIRVPFQSDCDSKLKPAIYCLITLDRDSPKLPPPSLARAEWEHIQRILGDTGGNVSETARRLGITRRTLQLKLKKYPPRV